MSSRSKAKRSAPRKPAQAPAPRAKTAGTADDLLQSQRRMEKAADALRAAQDARRLAVRKAWAAGTSAIELAALLGISRQKVYEIIGGVPRAKTGPGT